MDHKKWLDEHGNPTHATEHYEGSVRVDNVDWSYIYPPLEGTSPNVEAQQLEMFDEVERPEHYNLGNIECIDAIRASMPKEEFEGYLKGNSLKYLWRYRYKGKALQDLEKAQWYLTKLIESVAS